MKTIDIDVELTNGKLATISVFNIGDVVLSLIKNNTITNEKKLSEGYNIHTGNPTEPITDYREIRTGDAWEPTRKHFCGDYPQNMPLALIFFDDKSNFDLHGSLSTIPICFILSCFNKNPRIKFNFGNQLYTFQI